MPGIPLEFDGDLLMPLVRGSVTSATWNTHGVRRPVVWLIGHSFIHWAEKRASKRPGGLQMGFHQADVCWRGVRGLQWMRVLSEVVAVSKLVHGPAVIVIHAAGNDLCNIRLSELISIIRADFDRFPSFFRDIVLVWSEIIPRQIWRGARNPASIERARRLLNMRVSRHVRMNGGVVIRHRQLEGDNRELLLDDGIHLNPIGLDIMLSGLQDAIERALFMLSNGGRSSV